MTPLQKLQLRQSETRQKLATLLETDLEKRGETYADDLAKLTAALKGLEPEIQAAIMAQPDDNETRTEDDGAETPEDREYVDLLQRSSIIDYLGEALGEPVEGASRELREELDVGVGYLPLDVLETRADAATNVDASTAPADTQQGGIAGRVFAQTAGAYLGVQRPTVPTGTVSYVELTSGATADVRSDGVAKDAEVGTFTVQSVNPVRATARYLLGLESTARIRGLEEALRADLSATLGDKLDKIALNGQAAVTNVSPAVTGILGSLTAPNPAPTTEAGATDYLAAYDARVDGQYSQDGANVRMLVNSETYRHAQQQAFSSTGSELLRDRLQPAKFRVSANMPATASMVAAAISYTAGRRGYVQPVWRNVQIIRDPYTRAAEGQVALTVVLLTGGVMVDSNPFAYHSFKVA